MEGQGDRETNSVFKSVLFVFFLISVYCEIETALIKRHSQARATWRRPDTYIIILLS